MSLGLPYSDQRWISAPRVGCLPKRLALKVDTILQEPDLHSVYPYQEAVLSDFPPRLVRALGSRYALRRKIGAGGVRASTARSDFYLPITHQEAQFQSFGTPDQHKRFLLYDSSHWPLPMGDVIRETVDFLDRYVTDGAATSGEDAGS